MPRILNLPKFEAKKYDILPYTYARAKELNVIIHPSENPKYKIDLYDRRGLFMFSLGARGYSDYPHYIEEYGQEVADERRRLYKIRHARDRVVKGSPGWYADKLLW